MPNKLISRPQVKNTILSFLKNLVSKSILKSVDILLSPCCNLSIASISFECTDTDTATITVVLDKAISFPVTSTAVISATDDLGTAIAISYTGEKVLVFENFILNSGDIDVTYNLSLLLPTGTNRSQGIYEQASIITNNPTCS